MNQCHQSDGNGLKVSNNNAQSNLPSHFSTNSDCLLLVDSVVNPHNDIEGEGMTCLERDELIRIAEARRNQLSRYKSKQRKRHYKRRHLRKYRK